jgi:hypothetical protein
MIWPMKAGSVLLGRDAAEANDQGIQRGADEVKDDEVLFSTREIPPHHVTCSTANRTLHSLIYPSKDAPCRVTSA